MELSAIIFIITLMIIVLFLIASVDSLQKRVLEMESQIRYQEELIKQVNKAIPTQDYIERLIAKLIVRAERSTIVERK